MTNFYDGQITDILPHFLSDDDTVRALSLAIREGTRLLYRYAENAYVYCSIDTMPENILDMLAVELRTQYYTDDMDIDTKRSLVANTLLWYTKAGTPEAVEELISVVFGDADLEEWYEYGGEPYWFRISTDVPLGEEDVEFFSEMLKRVKNTRSHIGGIDTLRSIVQTTYAGTAMEQIYRYEIQEQKYAFAAYKDGTLTFVYDRAEFYPDYEIYMADDWPTGDYSETAIPWYSHRADITTVKSDNFGEYHGLSSLRYFFYGCSGLTNLDGLVDWDVSKVTTLYGVFQGCSSLTTLDGLAGWDVSKVTALDYAFRGCSGLTNLDGLADWDVSKVTTLYDAFRDCSGLTTLDGLVDWDVSKVTTLSGAFYGCSGLTNLDGLAKWDVSKVTTLSGAFQGCTGLTNLDTLADWDVSKVTTLTNAFRGCSGLTNLDGLKKWNTTKVTTISYLFYNCYAAESIDLTSWDLSAVTTKTNALYRTGRDNGCTITCTQETYNVLSDGTGLTESYITWNII